MSCVQATARASASPPDMQGCIASTAGSILGWAGGVSAQATAAGSQSPNVRPRREERVKGTLALMGAKSRIAVQDWYNAPKTKPIHFLQASLRRSHGTTSLISTKTSPISRKIRLKFPGAGL